jgi:hypothetical protein
MTIFYILFVSYILITIYFYFMVWRKREIYDLWFDIILTLTPLNIFLFLLLFSIAFRSNIKGKIKKMKNRRLEKNISKECVYANSYNGIEEWWFANKK